MKLFSSLTFSLSGAIALVWTILAVFITIAHPIERQKKKRNLLMLIRVLRKTMLHNQFVPFPGDADTVVVALEILNLAR